MTDYTGLLSAEQRIIKKKKLQEVDRWEIKVIQTLAMETEYI